MRKTKRNTLMQAEDRGKKEGKMASATVVGNPCQLITPTQSARTAESMIEKSKKGGGKKTVQYRSVHMAFAIFARKGLGLKGKRCAMNVMKKRLNIWQKFTARMITKTAYGERTKTCVVKDGDT